MNSDLYHIEYDVLNIAGQEVKVFAATNIDELLDHLISKGEGHDDVQDERIPYFVELWPSAIRLAELILEGSIKLEGRSVIEIGCGSGLAGLAAGLAGTESVLLTDYLPDALEFARNMWNLNLKRPAMTALLDWRDPVVDAPYDVILAADVAYEERNFQPLIDTFNKILAPNGVIYLTEPSRAVAKPFVGMLQENGFTLSTESASVFHQNHQHSILCHQINRVGDSGSTH